MEHLAMLARMLLIEQADGYADLKDTAIQELISSTQIENGIGSDAYSETNEGKEAIANLNELYSVFKEDIAKDDGGIVPELNREYFILSFYILMRHLRKTYVLDDQMKLAFLRFFHKFHERWRRAEVDDDDIAFFSANRQQGKNDLMERDIILRQLFFKFVNKKSIGISEKDKNRAFSESQRIRIYRRDKSMCQQCLSEGKSVSEAKVSWKDYEADHILAWSKGGETKEENGQVLCKYHNRKKGAD